MKEIKFRAWDKKEKEMIYGALEIKNIGLGEGSVLIDQRVQRGNELKWMQYIGLKDKNDKEIYEGDIVTDHSGVLSAGKRCLVKYGENYMGFEVYGEDGSWVMDKNWKKYEIIGNILENLELIKEKK